MASTDSSDDPPPATNTDVVVRRPLNPTAPYFFPRNPSLHRYYFSPPPIYFISDTNLPPPASIFVFYPLSYINPNPNQFESIQEKPLLHSPNPSLEMSPSPTSRKKVFGRRGRSGHDKKVARRRRLNYQVESKADRITTVMLRNIPNRYTREMMIEFLDKHCEEEKKGEKDEEFPVSSYDFLYLPMDFKSTLNKGYAFVNFTTEEAVSKFKAACNNKPWCQFRSRKGKAELVKHFKQMTYPVEAYSAVCFSPARSGPKNTVQVIMVGKCTEPMISV
ncbi:unnamed protein product [Microthlaspi erraticum]|uniref:RRM domain-containing protein n=1 Tax=Microthlaspi erraticum TaxID=1685480 RepID=A0A6D2IAK6_9BRAS|nr:unnamed protein product [Microthlaspi erraticum]